MNGSLANPVVFTSREVNPSINDWTGIYLYNAGSANLNYALVEYAARGIESRSTSLLSVSNSLFHFNGYGLYLLQNGAQATVTNTQLVYNDYGLFSSGTGNDTTNPQFSINGSDLFGNAFGSLYVDSYGSSSLSLDATGNWWGTAAPQVGVDIVGGSSSLVDFSGALAIPMGAPALSSVSVDYPYISPVNGDGAKDIVTLTAPLSESADWTVEVINASGNIIQSSGGSGLTITATWDGQDSIAQYVADGRYRLLIRTTAGTRSGFAGLALEAVDNTAPNADLDAALDNAIFQNVAVTALVGSATDANFENYQVEYSPVGAPANWSSIGGVKTVQVVAKDLGAWVLASSETMIPTVPNGAYNLKLTVFDLAGNRSTDTVLVTVDNLTVTSPSHSADTLDLSLGDTIDINFDINLPGTVVLRIYPEEEGISGQPIRTITQNYSSAGTYVLNWDGLDDVGVGVGNGAYYYTLEASDGTRVGLYQPTIAPEGTLSLNNSNADFNSYANDVWTVNVALTEPGLVQLELHLYTLTTKIIYPDGAGRILSAGNHTLRWDGRDPDTAEQFVGVFGIQVNYSALTPNVLRIVGNDRIPSITGLSPTVEVKTDPYLVYLSYGQITRMGYSLGTPVGETVSVTVSLLPPGVYDPTDPRAILVHQAEQPAGDYEVEWTGVLSSDPDQLMRVIGEDGAHTFVIQATSSTGETTLVRSVINAYQ